MLSQVGSDVYNEVADGFEALAWQYMRNISPRHGGSLSGQARTIEGPRGLGSASRTCSHHSDREQLRASWLVLLPLVQLYVVVSATSRLSVPDATTSRSRPFRFPGGVFQSSLRAPGVRISQKENTKVFVDAVRVETRRGIPVQEGHPPAAGPRGSGTVCTHVVVAPGLCVLTGPRVSISDYGGPKGKHVSNHKILQATFALRERLLSLLHQAFANCLIGECGRVSQNMRGKTRECRVAP